jgi:hypothetical protein
MLDSHSAHDPPHIHPLRRHPQLPHLLHSGRLLPRSSPLEKPESFAQELRRGHSREVRENSLAFIEALIFPLSMIIRPVLEKGSFRAVNPAQHPLTVRYSISARLVVHVQKPTLAFLCGVQGLMDLSERLCMHACEFLDMRQTRWRGSWSNWRARSH